MRGACIALDRGKGIGTCRRLAGPGDAEHQARAQDNQQDLGIAISSNECVRSLTTCVVTLQCLKSWPA